MIDYTLIIKISWIINKYKKDGFFNIVFMRLSLSSHHAIFEPLNLESESEEWKTKPLDMQNMNINKKDIFIHVNIKIYTPFSNLSISL